MTLLYRYTYFRLILIVLLVVWWQQAVAQKQPQERLTLMQYVIQERPLLANLITKAGLTPLLSADAPITLLAPSEADLQGIKQESPERLRAILSNHLLEGTYLEQDLKDGASVKTVGGTQVTICRKKDHTLVNGIRIAQPDQQLKNGVLHGTLGIIRI